MWEPDLLVGEADDPNFGVRMEMGVNGGDVESYGESAASNKESLWNIY
jgi:hypothetical protein